MQLRNSITAPIRLEDEELVTTHSRNSTKPARPNLMKASAIPFNPNNPPAAFPSLSLTKAPPVAKKAEFKQVAIESGTANLVPTTPASLPNSLAGYSSEDDGHMQQSQATPVDVAGAQVSNEQDKESDSVKTRVAASRRRPRTSGPSTAATYAISTASPNTIVAATPPTIAVQDGSTVSWSDLRLSLQYHIYNVLSTNYPSDPHSVVRLLGLTANEAKRIQEAVAVRALHPASIAQILAFCASVSAPIPGLQAGPGERLLPHIDRPIWLKYLGYMIFSINYDSASKAAITDARAFLSSRGLSPNLLGTWLADSADTTGREFVHFYPIVPGGPTATPLSTHYVLTGSPAHLNPTGAREARQRFLHSEGPLFTTGGLPQYEPMLEALENDPGVVFTKRNHVVHPLATVSWPGHAPTPVASRGDLQLRQQLHDAFRQQIQGRQQPISSASANDASEQAPLARLKSENVNYRVRSANPMDLQARRRLKKTPAIAPRQPSAHEPEERDDQEIDTGAVPIFPSAHSTTASQRLVLKVQETGLAQVVRETLRPVIGSYGQADLSQDVTAPSTSHVETADAPKTHASTPLRFDTAPTSSLAPRPAIVPVLATASARMTGNTLASPVLHAPVQPGGSLAGPTGAAEDHLKRKATQQDLRPNANKVPRLVTDMAPATPPYHFVSGNPDSEGRRQTGAKETHNAATVLIQFAADASTIMQPAGKHSSSGDDAVLAEVPASCQRSPPIPSFSPISENEDLPSFQALIRPVRHRLRAAQASNLGNFALSDHERIVEEAQDTPDVKDKKRPQTLKLIVKKPPTASSEELLGSEPNTGTSTKVLPPTSGASADFPAGTTAMGKIEMPKK